MPSPTSATSFDLRPRPPYRLDLAVAAARRRDANPLDRWQAGTLHRGLELVRRLMVEAGTPRFAGDPHPAFPAPAAVATVPPARWVAIGFSRMKARALAQASRTIAAGVLDLETLGEQPDDDVRTRLCALYGVGRWTSDVVLLRGLGRLHVFPRGDAGALGGLARWAGLGRQPDRDAVQAIIDAWRPYGGLLYLHVLLDGLRAREDLPG